MGISIRGFNKIASLTTVTLGLALSACTPMKHAALTSPEVNQDNTTENIVGGTEVQEGSALSKSVVLLVNLVTEEICTAALIGGNFAVTAAHCLDEDNIENMYVLFAAKPNIKTVRRKVLNAKASPYWKLRQHEDKNTSDIALIKFEGLGLPVGYEPVKFLENTEVLKNGVPTVVVGYGFSNPVTRAGTGVLRHTTLKISDAKFSPTELLLDQTQGSGACHGDSGGPAFVYLKDKTGKAQYYIWGIANHASEDDVDNLCNKSVIYTNATLFQAWFELAKKSL